VTKRYEALLCILKRPYNSNAKNILSRFGNGMVMGRLSDGNNKRSIKKEQFIHFS
jgi:hypothetical protein